MRDCPDGDLRDLLPDLAHDRLPPDEAARLRAHVTGCEACGQELSLLRDLRGVFRAPVEVDVDAVVREVMRRTAERGTPRVAAPAPRRFGWLRAAAVALVVGGTSWVVARPGTEARGVPAAAADLAFAGDVADLADEELSQLEGAIAELERQPLAEPEPLGEEPDVVASDRRGA